MNQHQVVVDSSAILGHDFGDKRSGTKQNISRASGLDPEKPMQLLSMLAPVVLGVLSQIKHKQSMDPQDVVSLLQNERQTAESAATGLAKFLDMDGDGGITEDVISHGANLLSSFFLKEVGFCCLTTRIASTNSLCIK